MRRRRSGLNFGRQKKEVNMSVVKEVCVWIIEIAITLLVAFTLVYFVGLRTRVVGQSMAETLNGGDEILVNRFIYKVTDPRPNDVIVFLPNGNEKSHYYIKRVIAVPGDTLQIKNGEVYVNGELFAEDVDVAQMEDAGLVISGTSPDGRLVETVELPGRDFHLGAQFHPEFKSRPNRAHPLFKGFIAAALKFRIHAQRGMMHV